MTGLVMRYTRIYASDDGVSHFEDVYPESRPSSAGRVSITPVPVSSAFFVASPPSFDSVWHVTPRRQFVIYLRGVVEIEVGDGETRRFGPGDVALVEDTRGQGHTTRVISDEERLALFVPLADEPAP